MSKASKVRRPADRSLPRAPTGIAALDEVTGGGPRRGRPTVVCGNAGCARRSLQWSSSSALP